jgi:Icc-related predicted phosphoesterase
MSLKIQIASDLHIEFKNDKVPDILSLLKPCADILILAGDIGSLYKQKQLTMFLKKVCEYFKLVIYVPGNHEYYKIENIPRLDIFTLYKRLINIQKSIDNLHILCGHSILIDNICIIGCTLWSDIKIPIPKYLVRIYGMNKDIYKCMYKNDVEYIDHMIHKCKNNNYKLIVVTHHCPLYKTLEGSRKKTKFHSLYASDLSRLLSKENVHTWICGHVHNNFDFVTEKGTRIVGNQKGKPKDNLSDYNPKFVINV